MIVIKSTTDYQKAAMRTLNDKGFEMNVLHCILGMTGELGELDSALLCHGNDEIIKEAGDALWYAAVLGVQVNVSFDDLYMAANAGIDDMTFRYEDNLLTAFRTCSRMIDPIKKTIFYGQAVDSASLIKLAVYYLRSILIFINQHQLNLLEICQKNITKLETRFPEKYEDFLAINRDTEAEELAIKGVYHG